MPDKRPPHDHPASEDAEPIIELTEVVASPEAADEEIIELTDVVEDGGGSEDVIELTDVVASSPTEEPIIELTEVVSPAEIKTDTTVIEAALASEEEDTTPPVERAEESTSGDLAFADVELDIENQAEKDLFDSMDMNIEADLLNANGSADELDFNLSTQELSDAIDLLDAKLSEEPSPPAIREEEPLSDPTALRSDDLEAALENVIKKMFGDKIDHLLNAAIEKTVSTEIARLKEQLLGDSSPKP